MRGEGGGLAPPDPNAMCLMVKSYFDKRKTGSDAYAIYMVMVLMTPSTEIGKFIIAPGPRAIIMKML